MSAFVIPRKSKVCPIFSRSLLLLILSPFTFIVQLLEGIPHIGQPYKSIGSVIMVVMIVFFTNRSSCIYYCINSKHAVAIISVSLYKEV